MIHTLAVPADLRIGGGALTLIGDSLASLGVRRPVIITDRYLEKTGLALRVSELLTARGMVPVTFDGTVPDPTTASLEAGLAVLNEHRADAVVGLGGGSPIDSAKALAVLAVHGGPLRELKAPFSYDGPALPIVAIPTTAGTGSEATMFTVVTDSETSEKMLVGGPSYLPRVAIVDYELTLSMPPRLTADTGIDALTHAVESYVSRKACSFTDALALEAVRIIGKNLRRAYHDGSDKEARSAMMEAATLAGIAFSNASVALVHGMSRPLGVRFKVTHGMSNAMLFPAVTAFSLGTVDDRYAAIARALGVADDRTPEDEAARALVTELYALAAELAVPSPEGFGVDRSEWEQAVPTMAQQALASGSPNNNPRVPSQSEVEALYQSVYAARPV